MEIENITSFRELVLSEETAFGKDNIIATLQDSGLIRRLGPRCCKGERMSIGRFAGVRWGQKWRCSKCTTRNGMLTGSLFQSTKLEPVKVLQLAFLYLHGVNMSRMQTFMGAISQSAVSTWTRELRDMLSRDLQTEAGPGWKLGGVGRLVVVGETFLAAQLRGSPQVRKRTWILGIYDVEAKKGTVEILEELSAEVVVPRIVAGVDLGSVINTGTQLAYADLGNQGYDHRTAGGVGLPAAGGTHTNHVRGYFSRMKKFLRNRAVKGVDKLPAYLDEFMWMERHKEHPWRDFLAAVRRQYTFR